MPLVCPLPHVVFSQKGELFDLAPSLLAPRHLDHSSIALEQLTCSSEMQDLPTSRVTMKKPNGEMGGHGATGCPTTCTLEPLKSRTEILTNYSRCSTHRRIFTNQHEEVICPRCSRLPREYYQLDRGLMFSCEREHLWDPCTKDLRPTLVRRMKCDVCEYVSDSCPECESMAIAWWRVSTSVRGKTSEELAFFECFQGHRWIGCPDCGETRDFECY